MNSEKRTRIFLFIFVGTVFLGGSSLIWNALYGGQEILLPQSPEDYPEAISTLNKHEVTAFGPEDMPDSCDAFCLEQGKVCIGSQVLEAMNQDNIGWLSCKTPLVDAIRAQCKCA